MKWDSDCVTRNPNFTRNFDVDTQSASVFRLSQDSEVNFNWKYLRYWKPADGWDMMRALSVT